MADTISTTCPYCGVGCGVLVTPQADAGIEVQGDPDHPANLGKLCSKGSALGETIGLEDRLLEPKINGRIVKWDEATQAVASGFQAVIDKHGPDAVAFYVSGQLLTEDYYVANKLIKGFLGTSNIDTNSRLCMSSSVVGHKRAFGSDTVPQTYEDLEKADLVVLTGSNLAWCHPVLYQRLKAARAQRGTKVVVIDPRKTATCEIADLHLAIAPGSDVMLFNGLLNYLSNNDAVDQTFVTQHVDGCEHALSAAYEDAANYGQVAQTCDISTSDLLSFYALFLQTEKTLTVYSQGVNQSSQGSDKVNAILNCHLLSGRIGKEGCGPLSVTGQPNAMGGREVGGLANMLAAHMDFTPDAIERVARFWNAPHMVSGPGLKAIDMFDAIHEGKIKAIWIMATNPVVSLPDANKVREALKKCELVVVSDCMSTTDTVAYAHIALPAATWGERNGTVTNTERRITRQHPFRDLPGSALPDWMIMTKVAHQLGYEADFKYEISHDVFKEHVALSALENGGTRDFDLSGWLDLSLDDFNAMGPTRWPVSDAPKERFFADGHFYTQTNKANMLALTYQKPVGETSSQYPLILNTGRVRDHWHTMTRTGLSARLSKHLHEPYVEVHPDMIAQENLCEGDLVKLTSDWGEAIVRLRAAEGQKRKEIFMPMHWSDENTARGVVGRLVNPVVDPFSGQPESKHTPVRLEKFDADWHGLLMSRDKIDVSGFAYWTRTKSGGCYIYDIAGVGNMVDWEQYASFLFGEGDVLSLEDRKRRHHRYAVLKDEMPLGVLIIAQTPKTIPSRHWLASLFEESQLSTTDRFSLLSAQPAQGQRAKGDIVCSCFNVGLLEIQRAMVEKNAMSVEAIGYHLKAGTNCGSCQSEITDILVADLAPVRKTDAA